MPAATPDAPKSAATATTKSDRAFVSTGVITFLFQIPGNNTINKANNYAKIFSGKGEDIFVNNGGDDVIFFDIFTAVVTTQQALRAAQCTCKSASGSATINSAR